jgi:hypothetical protein
MAENNANSANTNAGDTNPNMNTNATSMNANARFNWVTGGPSDGIVDISGEISCDHLQGDFASMFIPAHIQWDSEAELKTLEHKELEFLELDLLKDFETLLPTASVKRLIEMSEEEYRQLFEGPRVTIKVNNETVATDFPKRLLIAYSPRYLGLILKSSPLMAELPVCEDLDGAEHVVGAVRRILARIVESPRKYPGLPSPAGFDQHLNLYHAATLLRIDLHAYVLFKRLLEYMERNITLEHIKAIVERFSEYDPLVKNIVTIVNVKFADGELGRDFEEYLVATPKLMAVMMAVQKEKEEYLRRAAEEDAEEHADEESAEERGGES